MYTACGHYYFCLGQTLDFAVMKIKCTVFASESCWQKNEIHLVDF